MDVILAVQEYINKMLSNIQGMKVLVLDKETAGIVSMVYTQSKILQKEVFLFEKIENEKEKMLHMKGVYFLRPTETNINYIKDELKDPKYNKYHIFFTNTISSIALGEIAKADEQDVVSEVQEFFADFYAANPDTFTLNLPGMLTKRSPYWMNNSNRLIDGLFSSLLALKKKPYIRYSANSDTTRYVAEKIADKMNENRDLFEIRRQKGEYDSLLLILDRKDDPITPLLHQWTYQSMIHELLTISNNRVSLAKAPNIKEDLREVVLSLDHDAFYKDNLYKNFGDLGASIKDLVDQLQEKMNTNQNIQTIDDMKKFIEEYPDFQKFSTTVSKHVALMDELSRLISISNLMDVSEIQQELACNHDHNNIYQHILEFIENPKISNQDKLVIVLLYSIRYEDGNVWELKERLSRIGISPKDIQLIDVLKMYAGKNSREGDLLGTKNIFSFAKSVVKRGLQGVSNIYTQHKPLLHDILDSILKNKLSPSYLSLSTNPPRDRPQEIIIFMVGGITYEEALTVYTFNSLNVGVCRVILGGTTILNCPQFLDDLSALQQSNRR
ncbi:hypothetical protein DICPUDRAFT_32454 [Dictyostelium purpureum]|uniref:Vacuolar protein sorting-associated protein 45 n=1 Tax=Dictyostelium purpureum TaxID=5786 RepID=F0ZJ27_DICPU|nr:uncharacterized protein DICPUDRAFT_32454 [Dictyostelium purpureum]EGC36039.1 hypothetical protein DICPUDRAFT_32454 [Dictyostelium purpureum]|eukprot:XP_003287414.1 hypothetical protein DICPUDRAFT_32454 [Dictyostelium purpureum]